LPTVGNATRIEVEGIVAPESTKQKPFTPFAVMSYGICEPASFNSKPSPAPQAPAADDVCPVVHILPPTLLKPIPVGAVTLAQFWFFRSLQSLYANQEPWIPSELDPAATKPVSSGMIETPGQGAAVSAAAVPSELDVDGGVVPAPLVGAALMPIVSGASVGTLVSADGADVDIADADVAEVPPFAAGAAALGAGAALVPPLPGAVPKAVGGAGMLPESLEEHAPSAPESGAKTSSESSETFMLRR
jgi:hypothetical protein